jgi:hypothetical protein
MPNIYVDYGYDTHMIEADAETCSRIANGEVLIVTGQGFLHDEEGWFQDNWLFNEPPGHASVCLANGAEFSGPIVSIGD